MIPLQGFFHTTILGSISSESDDKQMRTYLFLGGNYAGAKTKKIYGR